MSLSAPGAVRVPTAVFSVQCASEPGVMPRLMELFAKRGIVPTRWSSHHTDANTLSIDVQMEGMDRDLAAYVGRCMRQVHGVETVLTSEKGVAVEMRHTGESALSLR